MKDVRSEQIAYYRARAAEYDQWFERKGRFDRGAEANARWFAEADEMFEAFDTLSIGGDVLELAPGTGIWTERILRHANSVLAVDASPEMIEICRTRLGRDAERVRFETADLFEWQPSARYDAVVFGFWISHIPLDRMDGFLVMLTGALKPGGNVFFVDGRREPLSTAAEHVLPEAGEETMSRVLNDGRSYQIVKNYYEPADLERRFRGAGLDVQVKETATYFIYGSGSRA